jgi:hypothetical protein
MTMASSANPEPGVLTQPIRLERRLDRLAKLEGQVQRASAGFVERRRPHHLRIRTEFAMRNEPAQPTGDLADRLLPPRAERPPATRLMSPRGIALRLYLTALFVMQSRAPGTIPRNTLPLADPDASVSWVDLLATTAEPRRYSTGRQLKLRQLHDALRRLESPEVQLVRLPNYPSQSVGRYEYFQLLHEAGDSQPYSVPSDDSKTLYLPRGLFDNGWIHVLEDSELAFLLMLACLRSRSGSVPVFATSETRLLRFGLGRDAYDSHRLLSDLGLVKVYPGPHPGRRLGKAGRYLVSDPPKLHRFELLNDGFEQPAIPTARQVLVTSLRQ